MGTERHIKQSAVSKWKIKNWHPTNFPPVERVDPTSRAVVNGDVLRPVRGGGEKSSESISENSAKAARRSWSFCPPRPPVRRLRPRVPRRGQRHVDDHVHGNQVGHSVIGGPHCAQDPLTGLLTAGRQVISNGRSGYRAFRFQIRKNQVRRRREEQRCTSLSAPVRASWIDLTKLEGLRGIIW